MQPYPRTDRWPGGYPNAEIARRLIVRAKSVANHVEHVIAKIGVRGGAAATLFATREGLWSSYGSA